MRIRFLEMNENIVERAIRGTHDFVVKALKREVPAGESVEVLDVAAGQGSLSQKLLDAGYTVSACELYPEQFKVEEVECLQADLNERWPYAAARFDAMVMVEVVEHIEDHQRMFTEAARVLKPGGKLLFTTPNILSLKSRMRFLFRGYFYSFGPISQDPRSDLRPHITPFTVDRYRWMLKQCGMTLTTFDTDTYQNSSRLLGWLSPLIRLNTRRHYGNGEDVQQQNSNAALFGRKLVIVARRDPVGG